MKFISRFDCFFSKDREMYFLKVCRKVFKLCLINIMIIIERLTPTKRGSICFSMTPGLYNGNSKHLFDHIVTHQYESINAFWLYDDALNLKSIDPVVVKNMTKRYSLAGLWKFLRADVVILSHGFGDFGLYAKSARYKKVVQLWHGVGIKCMGILDEKLNSSAIKRYKGRETRYYDYLIVSSDVDRYYSASYTGIDIRKVLVTGLPRNDIFINTNRNKKSSKFKILYAPTFRDKPIALDTIFFPFSLKIDELVHWSSSCNIEFYLRPHPNDTKSIHYIDRLKNINPSIFKDASAQKMPDCMKILQSCDGVITDYSSIYIDGLLRDLPCVFVDFDRNDYIKERGLAYDYDLVTPGPKVHNWEEFKKSCEDMLVGAPDFAEQRKFVRNLFFKYRDSNASMRVAKFLEKIVA